MRFLKRWEGLAVVGLYLVLSLLAVRGVLLRPGTIGHTVDWYVPDDPAYLARGYRVYLSMWTDTYLGLSGSIYAYNYPLHILLMAPGLLGISGEVVSKSFVLFTLLIGACSAYCLASYICSISVPLAVKERWPGSLLRLYLPAFWAGCLYAFGPTGFNILLSGAPQLLSSYAVAPLAFLCFLRAIRDCTLKDIVLASMAGTFMVASIQQLLLLYSVLPIAVITAPNRKKGGIALSALALFQALLMMYWILPVVSDWNYTITQPLATEEVPLERTLMWLNTRTDPLPYVFTTEWYMKRAGTTFSSAKDIPRALLPVWTIAVYGIVIAVFMVPLLLGKKTPLIMLMTLVALLFLGFSAGGKSPIRGLVFWVYNHGPRPLMGLFRYSFYWMLPVPLYYAALFGCVGRWTDYLAPIGRVILGIALTASVFLWTLPFWSGTLGNKVDVFHFPPELLDIDEYMLADKEYGRVLYLPAENVVLFEETEYQRSGYGGKDTILAFAPRPTLSLSRVRDHNSAEVTFLVQDALVSYPPRGVQFLLGITNVKYIILRRDVRPVSPRVTPKWNWATVHRVLRDSQDIGIALVHEYPHMSLWRNDRWWPHIYVTSNLIKVPEGSSIDCLPEIAASVTEGPAAILEDDVSPGSYHYSVERNNDTARPCLVTRQNNTSASSPELPSIRFEQVNPAKYEIEVTGAQSPYLLVFSETFHSRWVLRIRDARDQETSGCGGPTHQGVRHLLVNGYANGWWIDHPGTYYMTIEFLPQDWYRTGGTISGATLLFCLVYLLWRGFTHLLGWMKTRLTGEPTKSL